MKARFIKENINFERGGDTKASMNIGKAGKAKEILDNLYKNDKILTYKINSLDNIEIYFTDKYKDRVRGAEDKEPLAKWILRYIETPQFIVEEDQSKPYYSSKIYYYWSVFKVNIYNDKWPDQNKIEKKIEIEISTEKENAEKKANLIAEVFNKEFGPACGFELVETIKIPIEEI
ncbi:MAG: hypothetical protein PHF86_00785 [Candidatus Nanoarchaeia archaeon]|nr:hypothetical protein [Candidatus Nanoarchaeia archaeon]